MKIIKSILLLLAFSVFITGCRNTAKEESRQAQLEAEKARAEADSLKKLLEKNTINSDLQIEGQFPLKQTREAGKVNPVDEAPRNSSFVKFRNELLAAISRKDLPFLLKHTAEDVKISFGAEGGREDFKKMWFGEKPNTSEAWTILKKILELGGTYGDETNKSFIAPYVFTTFPDDYDAFTHAAITGQGVRLRSKPDRNSKHITSLSYDVVKWFGESDKIETIGGERHPWVKIKTLSGTEGYVFGKYIQSPIGFRAGFIETDGSWELTFFLAGD